MKTVKHNGIAINYFIYNDDIFMDLDAIAKAFGAGISVTDFLRSDAGIDILIDYKKETGKEFERFDIHIDDESKLHNA